MKPIVILIASTLLCAPIYSIADQYVNGYQRSDGTYVAPYYRTSPNNTRDDNYSTKGNTNPYTGKKGTVDPDNSTNEYRDFQENNRPSCGMPGC